MTYQFDTNNSPATGSVAMYEFKTHLKSLGWTVPYSSDGTTYNSSGDQITSGSSGANGMANNSAWFVIRHPTKSIEICIQRGASNTIWRLKIAVQTGFNSGSPGATRVPATDSTDNEKLLFGGGTDASPTFSTLLGTDNTYKMHVIANDTDGYEFSFLCYTNTTGAQAGNIIFDYMKANTYDSNDNYPFTIFASNASMVYSTYGNSGAYAFYNALFGRAIGSYYYATATLVRAVSVNPITGYDEILPIFYAKKFGEGVPGYKGLSNMMYYKGANRNTADTISISSSKDKIVYGDMVFPWDGSVPAI